MQYLKQNTAAIVLVGPVLDADGAAVTGAVIGDFRLAKNGTVSTMSGNTISHSHNGCYLITLTTTDTNTLDRLSISVGNTSYAMTVFRFTVLTSNQFDALVTNGTITVSSIQSGLATTINVAAVETKVDIVDTNIDTLLTRITANLFSGITYLSRWLGAIAGKTADTTTRAEINATPAGVTFNETTDSGEAIRDRGDAAWITGSSGAGSGARTVTVTVNDGSSALQNATVRMTEGSNTYIASTNASGVATFNLDDATYTVAITKSGYSYAGTTLVVDGNETVTYSMTATSITPSNPSLVTGYYTCYSELGVVESGVTVTLQVDRVPSETGLALDSAVRTATSDSNGLVQFTNLVPGAWYKVRRGEGNYYTFQISATATGSVELNSIIGT